MPMRCPRGAHGMLIIYTQDTHGLSMGCLMIFPWVLMGSPEVAHGLPMGEAQGQHAAGSTWVAHG